MREVTVEIYEEDERALRKEWDNSSINSPSVFSHVTNRVAWLVYDQLPAEHKVYTGMVVRNVVLGWEFEVGFVPGNAGDDDDLACRYTKHPDLYERFAFLITPTAIKTQLRQGAWVVV